MENLLLLNGIRKGRVTDLDNIKPNLYNPIQIVKPLLEYAYNKELNKNSDDIFGVSE